MHSMLTCILIRLSIYINLQQKTFMNLPTRSVTSMDRSDDCYITLSFGLFLLMGTFQVLLPMETFKVYIV